MHPLALIRHPYSNFSDSYTASSQSFPVSLLASRATTTYQTNANEQVHDFHYQFVKEGLKLKVKQNLKLDPDDALHQLLSQNIKKETEVSTLSQYGGPLPGVEPRGGVFEWSSGELPAQKQIAAMSY